MLFAMNSFNSHFPILSTSVLSPLALIAYRAFSQTSRYQNYRSAWNVNFSSPFQRPRHASMDYYLILSWTLGHFFPVCADFFSPLHGRTLFFFASFTNRTDSDFVHLFQTSGLFHALSRLSTQPARTDTFPWTSYLSYYVLDISDHPTFIILSSCFALYCYLFCFHSVQGRSLITLDFSNLFNFVFRTTFDQGLLISTTNSYLTHTLRAGGARAEAQSNIFYASLQCHCVRLDDYLCSEQHWELFVVVGFYAYGAGSD